MTSKNEPASPIVVAGAGIGGLSAAIALQKAGHDVVVMERAGELAEVGAGLQLSPNACSVLHQFGVLEALASAAYAPDNLRIWSAVSGELITKVELGDFLKNRHGHPFWVIHRADLQQALFATARQLDGITIRLNSEVLDIKAAPYDGLTCTYQTDDATGTLSCKALIGADGVWSKTRQLIANHENARFSGQVAYRATIPIELAPKRWHGDSGLWLKKDAHLVHYPIKGGETLNIVALVTEPWQDQTWSTPANKEAFLQGFRDWPAEVRNLLNLPERWLKWALCSVDASGPWSHGHIALLGDAAHAMLPYMAQGAAMAIEDAAILAKHLPKDTQNIPAALRAYERERKPRVSRIQQVAVQNMRNFHLSGPLAFARNSWLKISSPRSLASRYDDIYGWTAEQ